MAPPTQAALAATPTAAATTARSRPQNARKKANMGGDDAAYHGPASTGSGVGTKRAAVDKADGEPRVKRKRIEPAGSGVGGSAAANASSSAAVGSGDSRRLERIEGDRDGRISLIDFTTMSTAMLQQYLSHFDLVPEVDPSPLSADDPPPPSSLLRPRAHVHRHLSTASPGPPNTLPITPANRPRRDPANRRRSLRLVEDERGNVPAVVPVLADVGEVHSALATLAQRHFREQPVREIDTIASFLCAVKAKGES
ncbi:hypothetical protein OBBRIDRAFT_794719 [Obba rivulosa]|uniref:Histone deacetylase complex subunit SAP30 Sin3 binding domain-containing protein n=1 Tax=Obba rivulosa TaxID=1052685 RepID=A0A8E2B0M2_9APHY|nr:hypothetical protein OBBRIDRAFT_794719 [Obba rivulosa]